MSRMQQVDGPDPVNWELLDRYLAGECTPGESATVRDWLAADPNRASALSELRGGELTDTVRHADWTGDQFWRGLARRAAREDAMPVGRITNIPHIHGRRAEGMRRVSRPVQWTAWISAFCLIAGLAAFESLGRLEGHHALAKEYRSTVGERRSVVLADGTRFVLAPGSRLRVAANYDVHTRQVFLDGEAYFVVRHDARRPFSVQTGDAVIQDVGTIFDARAYPDEGGTRIAVVEGMIAVNSVTAAAGQTIIATDHQAVLPYEGSISALTAWQQGGLVFEKTPLREVVRDISRTFGVKITVADSALLSQRITATLSNEPLDVVLDAVVRVVGARAERTPQGVVIRTQKMGHVLEPARPAPMTTARLGDIHE